MTTTFLPSIDRHHDLRTWVRTLRDLERDGVHGAVRSVPGREDAPSGEYAFAVSTGPRRWLIGLLDARGPGEEAAATARAVAGHLRARSRTVRELPTLLTSANDFVRREARYRLVKATLIGVDALHHSVRIALAGAVTPLVVGRTGDVVPLGDRGPALGLVAEAHWRETGPVRLAPGHLLAAVTDGVVERPCLDGTAFSLWRVAQTMRSHLGARPRAAVRALLARVDAFGEDEGSDRTALALRVA